MNRLRIGRTELVGPNYPIGDVIETTDAQYEPAPHHLKGAVHDYVTSAYKLEGQLLLILAVDRMIEERVARWQ